VAAQAVPLQQYVIIWGVIAAVGVGIVTVLVLSRRRRGRSSEELAQAIRDALTKPMDAFLGVRGGR
jgi:carbon starvation protein CstA